MSGQSNSDIESDTEVQCCAYSKCKTKLTGDKYYYESNPTRKFCSEECCTLDSLSDVMLTIKCYDCKKPFQCSKDRYVSVSCPDMLRCKPCVSFWNDFY
jgi:hypothetical protein